MDRSAGLRADTGRVEFRAGKPDGRNVPRFTKAVNEVIRVIGQFVLVGLAALIVGFGANALRGTTSLDVTKNYFDTGAGLPQIAKHHPASTVEGASTNNDSDLHGATEPSPRPATPDNDNKKADGDPSSASGHIEHPYQTITFDAVNALLDDPLTGAGLNVVVDARSDQAFADGHITGAMLCSPYHVANYIDRDIDGQTFLERVKAAEKVVVYCGGGDCADSMFMCRELLELDVPYSSLYLYEGGWKDWTANGGRTEEGAE